MTDPHRTHIEFVLDRSGSMQSIKSDIEGGFDAFIGGQRTQPGECTVSLAQFDQQYEVVYTERPVADVPALDLQPRGGTAMLDAIGRSIITLGERLAALPEDARPGVVIMAIMTDGMENASREWTHAALKSLIEQQTRDYNWQFLYMGADQDAVEVGTGIGIPATRALTYGRDSSQVAMAAGATMVSGLRRAGATGARLSTIVFSDSDRAAAGGDSETNEDGKRMPPARGIRLPSGRTTRRRA